MDFIPVESSQIQSIGYDKETSTLGVRFHPGKKAREAGLPYSEYHYSQVSPEMFAAFRGSESKGQYFGTHIKPFANDFPFVKIC